MIISNTFGVELYYMVTASAAPSGWSKTGSIPSSGSVTIKDLPKDMYYQVYLGNTQPVTYENSLGTAPLLSYDATVDVSCSSLPDAAKK